MSTDVVRCGVVWCGVHDPKCVRKWTAVAEHHGRVSLERRDAAVEPSVFFVSGVLFRELGTE